MSFTIATWNILATAYIRRSFYPFTDPAALDPARRVPLLLTHAAALGADFLCLQEVEPPVFSQLEQTLSPQGFQGLYASKDLHKPDGCATFYRLQCARLLESACLSYPDGTGHIAQRTRWDIDGHTLTLLNTHLKWDPDRAPEAQQHGYRQALQAALWVQEAPATDAQILCGDLNVTPASRAVAALQKAGFVFAHEQLGPTAYSANSERRAKLIDFLFYRGALTLSPEPITPEIDSFTPLPSADQPSDHLPVLATARWAQSFA